MKTRWTVVLFSCGSGMENGLYTPPNYSIDVIFLTLTCALLVLSLNMLITHVKQLLQGLCDAIV